jgi:hypothetical protein
MADLAFLKTMAGCFKDVQDRYSRHWDKLQEEHKALELAEEKLKEKAEEIRTWYNEQSRNLRRQEEKLSAAKEKAIALDSKLAKRKVQLNAREKDLAA